MVIDLAEGLQQIGCEVTVAGAVGEGDDIKYNGVSYRNIGAKGLVAELSLLAKQNFDAVYAHRGWILNNTLMLFPKAVRLLGLIDNFLFSHRIPITSINAIASSILPVSDYLLQQGLQAGMSKQKLTRYMDGLPTELFRPDHEKVREENLIIFVGATIQGKGLPLLVMTMIRLSKSFPNLRLEIFGSSSMWGKNDHIDWSRLEHFYPYIRYCGSVSRDALVDIYQRATLCVIPSIPALIQEGFTRVSMEAQACGCPVVVSGSGGLPETIVNGKTGLAVHPLTSTSLSIVIEELLRNKLLLQRMSQEAVKHASQFDNKNTAKQFVELVEKLKSKCYK